MNEQDLYDARRKRLRQFMVEHFGGRGEKARLAEAVGITQDYISRIFSNAKHRKNIGEQLARTFEEKLRLPRYWLDGADQPDDHDALIIRRYRTATLAERMVVEYVLGMRPETELPKGVGDVIKGAVQAVEIAPPKKAKEAA